MGLQDGTREKPTRDIGVGVVAVFAAGAFFAAALLLSEAFEERSAANQALALQVAALNIEAYEHDGFDGPADETTLEWIAILRADSTDALRSLDENEAEVAVSGLQRLAAHGEGLLRGESDDEETHADGDLQGLLANAVRGADAGAAAAGRSAMAATILALFASVGLAAASVRRRANRQAEADAQMEQLREGRRIEALLNGSADMFFVVDTFGNCTYESASASQLFVEECDGASPIERFLLLAAEDDRAKLRRHLHCPNMWGPPEVVQLRVRGETAQWFAVRVSDRTDDPLVAGNVVTVSEISHEVELRNDLRLQAQTDHLTGLSNRRTLDSSLATATRRASASGLSVAFAVLDLDGFKEINDSLGHSAGDELLIRVTQRLEAARQPGDLLLRLGGDEFGVVLADVADEGDAMSRSRSLLKVFDEPFTIQNHGLESLRASIGVALSNTPDAGAGLIRRADVAMYEAKRMNGSASVLFEPSMEHDAVARASVAAALRLADYDEEFHLVFQPIVDSLTLGVSSLEALLRWDSPTVGCVGPDTFIPLAETLGEISKIGEWVLNSVCAQLSHWMARGLDESVTVSFNVSLRQLAADNFVTDVLSTVAAWGIAPEQLVVEVTESSVFGGDGEAVRRLAELRANGFKVSIDDFGSGYSNLGQLFRVPLDIIKVDRSLLMTVSELRTHGGEDPMASCSIMSALVSIAERLGAPVVCEGVETEAQRSSLIASGISYLQGYHTGRPVVPEELDHVLKLPVVPSRSAVAITALAA